MSSDSDKQLRVGVNGLGRIGRAIFRINHAHPQFRIVALNEINPDNRNIAYLLQRDTTYGLFEAKVTATERGIVVNGETIPVFHEPDLADVPWAKAEVDVVLDSSGVTGNLVQVAALPRRIRNVVVTHAPEFPGVQPIVVGCNERDLVPESHRILSSSICDAVALSPIAELLMQTVGIESGHLVTLHPWLGDQNLLDRPYKLSFDPGEEFSNYALGRAAPNNLIPKVTSAVRAASKIVAGLGEVLGCFSYRVPTNIVSSAVLTVRTREFTTRDRVIELLQEFIKQQERPILQLIEEPLISGDFIGNEHSAIVDKRWISVIGGRHLRLMYWYDNEWGYSSRVVDLLGLLGDYYAGA